MIKRNFLKNIVIGGIGFSIPLSVEKNTKLGYLSIDNMPYFPDGKRAGPGDVKLIFENEAYKKELIVEANDKEGWFVSIGKCSTEYKDGIRCCKDSLYPNPVRFNNINFTMKLEKLRLPVAEV